jgi:hypothetical protein
MTAGRAEAKKKERFFVAPLLRMTTRSVTAAKVERPLW